MKKKNEWIYWLLFILVLFGFSIYIISYFNGNRVVKVEIENNNKNNIIFNID